MMQRKNKKKTRRIHSSQLNNNVKMIEKSYELKLKTIKEQYDTELQSIKDNYDTKLNIATQNYNAKLDVYDLKIHNLLNIISEERINSDLGFFDKYLQSDFKIKHSDS